MSINNTNLTGNIGNNCQLHQTANTTIASFPLAISTGFGQNQKTSWVTCKLFGNRAEKLGQYLLKGVKVAVSGQLSVEEWEKDGVKQSKPVILVSDIDITNFKSESGSKQHFDNGNQVQAPQPVQAPAPTAPPANANQVREVNLTTDLDDFDDDLPF